MNKNAWNDLLVRINLSDGSIKNENIDPNLAREYVGGRGLATKILLDEGVAKADPLSEDNKLILMTGPMTGAQAPTTGRWMAVTKSPLNNMINTSNSGGTWGAKLKHSGIDGIILEGKSAEPVYILIEEGEISIHPAGDLWGMEVKEVSEKLEERHQGGVTMAIGQGGENLSPMASIMNDVSRAAGRGGAGAVMGSKNLKAVIIKTSNNKFDKVSDTDKLSEVNKRVVKIIRDNPTSGSALGEYGTAVLVNIMNEIGGLPFENWQESFHETADKISGETMTDTILTGAYGCYRCPIRCGRRVEIDKYEEEVAGAEYETIWGYGSACGIDDLEAITEANTLCDLHGLDTISTPITIATAMELFKRGYITEEDCDGVNIEFGSTEAIVEWTKRIAKQESDLAKLMAQGSLALARHYGVEEYSMSVKGLEMPAYDARAVQGIGLNYATSNRGADHCKGYTIGAEVLGGVDRTTTEGKGKLVKDTQDLTAVIDSLGMCLFTSFALGAPEYRDLFYAATGHDLSVEEIMETGERIYNVERLFNMEAGMDPSEDKLPDRLLNEPIPEGPSKGMVSNFDDMLPDYYAVRGWKDAFPTQETLERLNINYNV